MLQGVFPVLNLGRTFLLERAALEERIAEIVLGLLPKRGIGAAEGVGKRLQSLFQLAGFVGGRAQIKLNGIRFREALELAFEVLNRSRIILARVRFEAGIGGRGGMRTEEEQE